MTELYMHILKLSDIVLHTILNVSFIVPYMAHYSLTFTHMRGDQKVLQFDIMHK